MSGYYNRKRPKQDDRQEELFQPTLSLRDDVEQFLEMWNGKVWLPKLKVTPRQVSLIREAMLRPYFRSNWREVFQIMAKCPFLWSKMRPKITVDWLLISDNFDKVMEGKYLDQKTEKSDTTIRTEINKDGEEVILPPTIRYDDE